MLREDGTKPNGTLTTPTPEKSMRATNLSSMRSKLNTTLWFPREMPLKPLLTSGRLSELNSQIPTMRRRAREKPSETRSSSMPQMPKLPTMMLLLEKSQRHHQFQVRKVKAKVKANPKAKDPVMEVRKLNPNEEDDSSLEA